MSNRRRANEVVLNANDMPERDRLVGVPRVATADDVTNTWYALKRGVEGLGEMIAAEVVEVYFHFAA